MYGELAYESREGAIPLHRMLLRLQCFRINGKILAFKVTPRPLVTFIAFMDNSSLGPRTQFRGKRNVFFPNLCIILKFAELYLLESPIHTRFCL